MSTSTAKTSPADTDVVDDVMLRIGPADAGGAATRIAATARAATNAGRTSVMPSTRSYANRRPDERRKSSAIRTESVDLLRNLTRKGDSCLRIGVRGLTPSLTPDPPTTIDAKLAERAEPGQHEFRVFGYFATSGSSQPPSAASRTTHLPINVLPRTSVTRKPTLVPDSTTGSVAGAMI